MKVEKVEKEMVLKKAIKSRVRYILRGCPKCEEGALYQYWGAEYHCMTCGYVIYGDLLDTYDPHLLNFLHDDGN